MLERNIFIGNVSTFLAICFLLTSCAKEIDLSSEGQSYLNFKSSSLELVQSKSVNCPEADVREACLVSEDGSLSIPVIVSVTEESMLARTKATEITESAESFYAQGYKGGMNWFPSTNSPGFVEIGQTYDDYPWKNGVIYHFYAYSNNIPEGMSAEIKWNGVSLNVTKLTDDGKFTDVVLGRYSGNGGETGTAEMEFFHPFAGVRINNKIDNLTGVSILGIYTTGKTMLTRSTPTSLVESETGGYKVADFEWTNLYTGALKLNPENTPFLFIPQDFTENNAYFKFDVDGGTSLYLRLDSDVWKSGRIYNYTVSCK